MEEKEYFEFHLQTIWKTYHKLNFELYTNKERGSVYEGIPHFAKDSEDQYKKLNTYEEFNQAVMDEHNRSVLNQDYVQTKSRLFQSLRKLGEPEFMKEYINEIILNSSENYSTAFIENRFKIPMHQGSSEYIKELLPQMSHENTLCYFNQIETWQFLRDIIEKKIPLIKDKNNSKEFLFTSLKNCYEKDKYEIKGYAYKAIMNFLINNYTDTDLKTFEFLPDIESFLLSKNKAKDIVTNQNEDVVTTKISVDCEHARNIYYLEDTDVGNYCALINELMDYLKKDSKYNILDVNILHKYDTDQFGREKKYKISEVFIDTKEYDPNLKQNVSNLINKYVKYYIEGVRENPKGINFEKITENWLLQENLNSELEVKGNSKTKVKKL
jgi:hypothetical protein